MSYESIELSIEDGVAHIILNRPEDANSLNLQLAKDYFDVAMEVSTNSDVRAVLMTARGSIFSAGGDLKYFADKGDDVEAALHEVTAYLHAGIAKMARMDAPLIIGIDGVAAGAGMSIAASGDLVLATESSRFTMAYTAAGLAPDGSSSFYLPRVVGLRRAQELMLTNRMLSAQEALDWGLLTKVVPDGELMDEAMKLAKTIAKGPTKAYGQVKNLLLTTFGNGLETQMEDESRAIASMGVSADGREGVDAFLNKRKPEYKGQ